MNLTVINIYDVQNKKYIIQNKVKSILEIEHNVDVY